MFKALIIAYYFPPMGLSGVQRTLKFTKYMSSFNWKPTVITGSGSSYFAYDMSLLKEAEDSDIEIIRTEPFDPKSILKKRGVLSKLKIKTQNKINSATKKMFIPDNKVMWAQKAYKKAKEILGKEEYDVIYVVCPPFSAFTIATKLKKEFDLPLFVDYRDLWYDNKTTKHLSPYHAVKNKNLEDTALRAADKVIVVNRKIKEWLLTKFPFLTFDDILIIPNGYDQSDFEQVKPFKKHSEKMIITYSGLFNENASPKYFFEAFKKFVIERPELANNIELHFIGKLRSKNKKLVKELKLEKYVFDHGLMDHTDALKYSLSSDILWMMVENNKNAFSVTGGKLYEYFGTRKPIIACVPEGAAKIAATEYGAAFIVNPDDIESIRDTIGRVYALYKEGNLPKPDTDFVESINRKHLTERLTKEFQFFIKEM